MELDKNIIFVISVNEKLNDNKAISPFTVPQIESLIPLLDKTRVVRLTSGFGIKRFIENVRILKEIQREAKSPIILHSLYGSLLAFTVFLSIINKNKFVISFGGSDLLGSRRTNIISRIKDFITIQLSLLSAKGADSIIVKSKELFLKLPKKEQLKSKIIPNGVDLNIFKSHDIVESRKKLGWKKDEYVVLFNLRRNNSKLEYVKNYPLALKTIAKVKEFNSNSRLEIIQGKSHQEISRLMSAANCLLLTSFHEGSPNIVKEAMACNLPVMSVDIGDVNEMIGVTPPNFVSKSFDSRELSQAIITVLKDKSRSNSRSIILSKNLSLDSTANKIINLYNKILRNDEM